MSPTSVSSGSEPPRPADADAGKRESARQIRGSGLLLAGRTISLGLNLLVQIATVRVLSKDGYGVFAYAMSIAAIAEGLVGLGLPRAVARFVPMFDEMKDRARVLGTIVLALVSTLAGGCVVVVLVVGLRGTLAGGLGNDASAPIALAILSLLAPLQGFDRLFLELFSVCRRTRKTRRKTTRGGPGGGRGGVGGRATTRESWAP